jgi:hypothetical protein
MNLQNKVRKEEIGKIWRIVWNVGDPLDIAYYVDKQTNK